MKPVFHSEFVGRTTIEPEIMADPARLLSYLTFDSMRVLNKGQEQHYEGYGVSTVAPVFDSEGNPKILSASNYRPDPKLHREGQDIRVCAEQALIDNALHEGDISAGVLVVRGPRPNPKKPIVGCREMKTLHLCRPCRGRLLGVVGPELLIVTFVDDAPEPEEEFTLGAGINYHDLMGDYPGMPKNQSARDVAVNALGNLKNLNPVSKPRRAKRTIKQSERTD